MKAPTANPRVPAASPARPLSVSTAPATGTAPHSPPSHLGALEGPEGPVVHAGRALPDVQRVVEQQPVPARELKRPVPNTRKPEAFLITQLNIFAYSKFLSEVNIQAD